MSTSLSYYNVNTKKKASNSKRKTKTKLKNKQSKTKKNMKGSGPTFSMPIKDSLNENNNIKNKSIFNSIMSLHPGVSNMYEGTNIPKNKKSLKKPISVSAPKPKSNSQTQKKILKNKNSLKKNSSKTKKHSINNLTVINKEDDYDSFLRCVVEALENSKDNIYQEMYKKEVVKKKKRKRYNFLPIC